MKKLLLLMTAALCCAAALLAACGGDDDGGSNGAAAVQPTVPAAAPSPTAAAGGATSSSPSVSIIDFGYSPATLSLRAGQATTINVRNTGQAPHTFTIDGVADSGRLAAGASGTVQFTPSQAGTLTYYCTVHGRDRMSGTLTVMAGGSAAPQSAPQQPAGGTTGSGASNAPAPGYDSSY